MSQPIQNITIAAPGFKGLNTEDSPVGLDPAFAAVAENTVIDKFGRIGARKGRNLLTASATILGSSLGIEAMIEHKDTAGVKTVFSAGNNLIFSGTTTLVDETPAAYTITTNNWKMVNFNYHCYFFQRGYEPLVYSDHVGAVTAMTAHPHATGVPPKGNEVLAAYGRLFVADTDTNTSTVYWSDLLDGTAWTGGTSGSINLTNVWPEGFDEIVALAAHNGFLVIFGKRSILVYSGASSPSTMALSDTVSNIGCIARDSVQNTGTDLLFLSDTGVRSLGRTIQEKSLPVRDISKNVRSDMMALVSLQTSPIKSVYSPEEAFYLLTFPTSSTVYCFDMRTMLEDGSQRATLWTGTKLLSLLRIDNGDLLLGNLEGINTYDTYLDNTDTYQYRYFPTPMSFGDTSRLKILKEIRMTVIGGQSTVVTVNWGYDYSENYQKQVLTIKGGSISEFGIAEFNGALVEFSGAVVDKKSVNPTGNGNVVSIGLEAVINTAPLSIQEMNIQALMGRIV